MSKPFFERLKKYYTDMGNVLRGEADLASIFPNTTDIGGSRERVYAEILRSNLPSSCNVVFGGFLFDRDGNESKQIDILITNESSVQFNFLNRDGSGKSFACIDGCIGVVSVKSRLDSAQLVDALSNLASIPNKQPLGSRSMPLLNLKHKEWIYNDWPYKVIYASDGIELPNIMESLKEFYTSRPEIPIHKSPNLIHVSGKYAICRTGAEGRLGRDGTIVTPNTFCLMADKDKTDVSGLIETVTKIQQIAMNSKFILCYYNDLFDKIL